MDAADLIKVQGQFARDMSEFSTQILSIWSDAAERMGLPAAESNAEKSDIRWVAPSESAKASGPPAAAEKLQETMVLAVADLPVLMTSSRDPGKIDRIASKWEQFCEQSVRHLLGIPEPDETTKLLDHWRSIMAYLPSAHESTSISPFRSVISLISPSGWSLPSMQDAERQLFSAWAGTYGKACYGMFLPPLQSRSKDVVERTHKAITSQISFLQCLTEFQDQLASASRNAVRDVLKNLQEHAFKDMSAETQKLFGALWISAYEKMFRELLSSDSFLKTLAKIVELGLDAKRKMEDLLSDWSSSWGTPDSKNVENLQDKLYTLEKRVRLLERELDDLKRERAKPLPRETSLMRHEE